jgi:phage protein D
VALLQGKREGNDLAAMGAGLVAGTLTMDAIVELVRVARKEDLDVVKKAVEEAGVEEGETGEDSGAKKKKKKKKKKKVPGEEEAGAAEEILQIAQLRLIDMVHDACFLTIRGGIFLHFEGEL